MTLSVELPAAVFARLEEVATARGVTVEQLAAETLSHVSLVDPEIRDTVRDTIVEHREILERLSNT